ncbi:MAG: Anaerobic nitric oxide reductase transcription regulator NorR [Syntrophus sp. SKADARSKE-3]|nr:Anaerobic nitric oxide reductase transcription regulator NorR [Syntrophus sp. SKADARSKE-3]
MGTAKNKNQSEEDGLRLGAEQWLNAQSPKVQPRRTADETSRVLHELQVHQIELEMQNTELRRTQVALEISRNKYAELYDFAPIGYFTFNKRGLIRDVNLAGAQMLGIERKLLVDKPFIGFIADTDGKDIFSKHIENVLQQQGLQRCEIRLTAKEDKVIYGQIQSVRVDAIESKEVYILSSIVDGTVYKQLGEALQKAHDKLELTVAERTKELTMSNVQLIEEVGERKRAEESLREALAEIKMMKDQLEAENYYFRQEIKMKHQFKDILGQSDGLKYVLYRAEQVAPTNTTILILGETGTGKELIAAAVHNMSPRKERPLITVNCAALPGNLIESELFGREKGAFTGADTRQVGRFEIAHGSTLCLDEIGELPLELQAKLLRVIQHNEFERLGSSHTIKVDVRIIATTNRDLEEEVRKGRFRQDLFYRLNVFPITVPPLRQRKDDIPLMVQAFIARYSRKMGKQITSIDKKALKLLQDYPWPGNVRELESTIERAVILCHGPVLQLTDKLEVTSSLHPSAMRTLEEAERNQILSILSETRWRIEGKDGAASILGLHASTLRARMHKLGITRPETKEPD